MTDKITARILVVALTFLASIGLVGTLYLIAKNPDSQQISTFVALAGVPIGAVAALATTRNAQQQTDPIVIPGPPGPPGPPGEKGDSGGLDLPTFSSYPPVPNTIWSSSGTTSSPNYEKPEISVLDPHKMEFVPTNGPSPTTDSVNTPGVVLGGSI